MNKGDIVIIVEPAPLPDKFKGMFALVNNVKDMSVEIIFRYPLEDVDPLTKELPIEHLWVINRNDIHQL